MSEVQSSSSADVKPAVENQSNVTMGEFIANRIKQKAQVPVAPKEAAPEPKPEAVEAVPEPEAAEVPAEPKEGGDKTEKAESEGKDVLSKLNVDELSDEDIAELAQKGKSGLLKRIAELTAKRKLAEERAEQLAKAMNQQPKAKLEEKVENNPFSNISKAEDLQKKYSEVGEVIEWAEGVLDQAEHLGHNDAAATVDGKEVTKAQVKDYLRNARRARDKFLPAQLKEIQASDARAAAEAQWDGQARKEISWMEGEDNDARRSYESVVSSPIFEKVRRLVPEAVPDMKYLAAHAVNSIYARRLIPMDKPAEKPAVPRGSPPAAPAETAAAPSAPAARADKAVKEQSKRFQDSGTHSDFVALRTQQYSQRRKAIS